MRSDSMLNGALGKCDYSTCPHEHDGDSVTTEPEHWQDGSATVYAEICWNSEVLVICVFQYPGVTLNLHRVMTCEPERATSRGTFPDTPFRCVRATTSRSPSPPPPSSPCLLSEHAAPYIFFTFPSPSVRSRRRLPSSSDGYAICHRTCLCRPRAGLMCMCRLICCSC
jgi:hypothetical protein